MARLGATQGDHRPGGLLVPEPRGKSDSVHLRLLVPPGHRDHRRTVGGGLHLRSQPDAHPPPPPGSRRVRERRGDPSLVLPPPPPPGVAAARPRAPPSGLLPLLPISLRP